MKINKIILLICSAILPACVDLDYNELGVRDEEWIYDSPLEGVSRLVTSIYGYIPSYFTVSENGALRASACDEADFVDKSSNIHKYYNGGWSPINSFSHTWSNSYKAIAEANMFLEKLDKIDLEEYKYNVGGNTDYELLKQKFALFPYEVRALRAYFYFELVKTYGNVPLVTKTISNEEANVLKRDSYEVVFQFIVDECDAIVEHLPIDYMQELSQEIGRTNRAFVLALKARTLLYAASPLFNPSGDKDKWLKAVKANKEVIDRCKEWGISLSTYQSLWGHDNFFNPEMIFMRGAGERNDFERNNFPVGVENGNSGNCPTQSLVDAYEYKATGISFGKTWKDKQVNLQSDKPFDGLDPRFAFTIVKHGDQWPSYNTHPIEVMEGGRNASPLFNATTTGYYLKKYCDGTVNISTNSSNTKRHSWIIFRLGEFYLNYAEAVYNYTGNADDKSEFGLSANEAINILRDRPDIQMPHFSGNADFEERYRRERMVELAFEDHRFWDIRRWKIGNVLSSVQKMNFKSTAKGDILMERATINRQWDDKYYLYPIPYTERYKNPNLEQNPGW